jgi:hypothetical protein
MPSLLIPPPMVPGIVMQNSYSAEMMDYHKL